MITVLSAYIARLTLSTFHVVPLRITHPRKLAGEHRVIIVSECLGKRLRQRLMRILILAGRRALHAPIGGNASKVTLCL